MTSPNQRIRVLIIDDDTIQSRRLADYISARGFEARLVVSGREARQQILEWQPRFILTDLILSDGNALELIDFVRTEKNLRHRLISVMVISGHNSESNVIQCVQKGAIDYIVKPCQHEDILKRLVFHSRGYRQLREIATKEYAKLDDSSLMLHLTNLVLRQALASKSLKEILLNLTRMVSIKVDGVRCSVIQCLDQKEGVVVISNDDASASGIQLDLYKYPEVLHVLNTQHLVAIENLEESAELRFVLDQIKEVQFNSMIVCPVTRMGQRFGVLSLRMPPEKQVISDSEIRFVENVSHVVSLVLNSENHRQVGDFWLENLRQVSSVIPFRTAKNS